MFSKEKKEHVPVKNAAQNACTVDPRLTDDSTYRLFELQTSLAAKFRFDFQPENRPTDQEKNKMEQKWNKNGQLRH